MSLALVGREGGEVREKDVVVEEGQMGGNVQVVGVDGGARAEQGLGA